MLDSEQSPLGKLLLHTAGLVKSAHGQEHEGPRHDGELLQLFRPAHHKKLAGLEALARRNILTKLQRIQAPAHAFKVLVVDDSALEILAP